MSSLPYFGRLKPYTDAGIRRLPCSRCGEPASRTWAACANGNRYAPLCDGCDVELNELVLRFMRIPKAEVLLEAYRKSMAAGQE